MCKHSKNRFFALVIQRSVESTRCFLAIICLFFIGISFKVPFKCKQFGCVPGISKKQIYSTHLAIKLCTLKTVQLLQMFQTELVRLYPVKPRVHN